MSTNESRKLILSVTNFLVCDNKFLFLKRHQFKRIDPGKINGVGGTLEKGENFIAAVIRETEEETGYKVQEKDIELKGIVQLRGGYSDDWLICFFRTCVPTTEIPLGNKTNDGELIWLTEVETWGLKKDLVDDLNYCFQEIVMNGKTFFISAEVSDDFKLIKESISKTVI